MRSIGDAAADATGCSTAARCIAAGATVDVKPRTYFDE
jgi:hypothetical protein